MKAMKHTEFRAWRVKRGMTQRQAADYLSLSIATIRAYEASPRRTAKFRTVPPYLPRFMEALECTEVFKMVPAEVRRQAIQAWRKAEAERKAAQKAA
jgi:transcriptional regulator with XRE-family HTH domain